MSLQKTSKIKDFILIIFTGHKHKFSIKGMTIYGIYGTCKCGEMRFSGV